MWWATEIGEGVAEGHTRLITLAILLQLSHKVFVFALPALAVLKVVFL